MKFNFLSMYLQRQRNTVCVSTHCHDSQGSEREILLRSRVVSSSKILCTQIARSRGGTSQADGRLAALQTELPELLAEPALVGALAQNVLGEAVLLVLRDDRRADVGQGQPQPLGRPLEAGLVQGQEHLRVRLQAVARHASACRGQMDVSRVLTKFCRRFGVGIEWMMRGVTDAVFFFF